MPRPPAISRRCWEIFRWPLRWWAIRPRFCKEFPWAPSGWRKIAWTRASSSAPKKPTGFWRTRSGISNVRPFSPPAPGPCVCAANRNCQPASNWPPSPTPTPTPRARQPRIASRPRPCAVNCGKMLSRRIALRRHRGQSARGRAGTGCVAGLDRPALSPKRILGEGLMAAAAWQCVAACDAVAGGRFAAANVSLVGSNQQAIGARFVRADSGISHLSTGGSPGNIRP